MSSEVMLVFVNDRLTRFGSMHSGVVESLGVVSSQGSSQGRAELSGGELVGVQMPEYERRLRKSSSR
jgi:hypothetical protein